jgi:hypothetical protein
MSEARIARSTPVTHQEWSSLAAHVAELVEVDQGEQGILWGVRSSDLVTEVEDGAVVVRGSSLVGTEPLLRALADALEGHVEHAST